MTKEGIFFSLKRFNDLQFYYNFYRFTTTMLPPAAGFVPSVSAIACPVFQYLAT
jgi:hypothetical protein